MLSILAVAVLQAGPVLPVGVAPHIARANFEIQQALSVGDFAAAERGLAQWPSSRVTYSLEGLPERYAAMPEKAAQMVAEAAKGLSFVKGSPANVVFTFGPLPAEGPPEPVWKNGRVEMMIPITSRNGDPANERSILWSLAKGMGYAAGLDISTRRRSVMSEVVYAASVADPAFAIRELAILEHVSATRAALAKAAADKQRITVSAPKLTVSPSVVEMGKMMRGELREFTVAIKNVGNAPAVVEIETTCSCIITTPNFTLPAGEEMVISPKFNSSDYEGHLERQLLVLSNAPEGPRQSIVLKALIMPEVRFLPPKEARPIRGTGASNEISELEISDTGTSQIELLFFGTVADLEIIDLQVGNPSASTRVVPFSGVVDDPMFGSSSKTGSKVLIDIPADWPYGVSWLRVVGLTSSRTSPAVEMTLQLRRGISASPQNVFFGGAKVGEPSERVIYVEHLSKPFRIEKVEADNGISATAEAVEGSDKRYRLRVKVTPTAAGPISGTVRVHTNSSRQPVLAVSVGGHAE